MSRTAVLAVVAAVVLIGTAQVASAPNRVPDDPSVWTYGAGGSLLPFWLTMVQDGTPRGPLPLASSIDTVTDDEPAWFTGDGFGYAGAGAALVPDLQVVSSPYTEIVVSPTGQVLAVCLQRGRTWVPPCLLDGVAQVK
ncbi:MAG: hypothetical protein KJ792_12555 [Actinobacteria bacterium]|nr:hypothetical protein [Actinomycetota bacterium]MCG2800940.1 hypothetical protein [Cellulomonas sp.]